MLPRLLTRPWLTVYLLWIIAVLNYLDRLMITAMHDPIKADIAMTDAQFGLLTSVFLWVYGLFSPLGGYLADKFNRRYVIIGSLLIWSLITWLTSFAHSLPYLLITRAFMGISEACYIPAALALIADYHPKSTRSTAVGLHMTGIYTGAAIGGIGGVIAEHYNWKSGFQWFGAIGIVYSLILILCLRDSENIHSESKSTGIAWRSALTGIFSGRAFLWLLAANACFGIANWGINGWLPTYLRDHFKLGLGSAGMTATGYIQIASFFGVLLGGLIADRWIKKQVNAHALVPALGFCVVAPCLFFCIKNNSLFIAILGLITYGIGRGFFDANLMPALRKVVNEKYSATGYGILNLISVTVGGALIYIGGVIKDSGLDLVFVFYIAALALLICGLLLFMVKSKNRLRPTEENS